MEENFKYADLTYLKGMAAGSNDLIKEMIEIFSDQIPEFIEELNQHLQNKDFEKLASVAHKAKSSINIMGLEELAKDLKTLELLAKEGKEQEKYIGIVEKFILQAKGAAEELNAFAKNL